MKKLIIGLDFGSDSVRAVLVSETGEILASKVHNYTRWSQELYCDATKSQFRQHPQDYLEGTIEVIKGVLVEQDNSKVIGIAIDTTGSTPCAVDENGTPLALLDEFKDNPNAMFILWKDHTALAEANRINEYNNSYGGINYLQYEGGIYSSEWFFCKLLHILRVDEAVRDKAVSFVEHCDWISHELTGNTNPKTMKRSRCAAGHKAMWHESWGGLPNQEFLSGVDSLLDNWSEKLYTETYTADEAVGKLSQKWADILGLSTEVIIGGSAFDCHAGAVGAGAKEYELVKVIGTSTCDILVAPNIDKCVRGICGQVDGSVFPKMIGLEAGQSAFGDVYAWFKRYMNYAGDISLPNIEKEAGYLSIENNGIIAIDWFNGRRTPDANQNLTGAILGLNLGTTPTMVFRALVEATAFGAKAIIDRFIEEEIRIDSVLAIGGISMKSSFVMQICADVWGLPIKVSACDQACALGSAMFAAVASGVYKDIHEAIEKMGQGFYKIYEPNMSNHEIYTKKYKRYLEIGKFLEKETMQYV